MKLPTPYPDFTPDLILEGKKYYTEESLTKLLQSFGESLAIHFNKPCGYVVDNLFYREEKLAKGYAWYSSPILGQSKGHYAVGYVNPEYYK